MYKRGRGISLIIKKLISYKSLSTKFPVKTKLSLLVISFLFLAIPLTVIAINKARDYSASAGTCDSSCNWPDLSVSWSKKPYYLIEWCINTTSRGSGYCEKKNKTGGTSTSILAADDWKMYWWVDTLLFDPYPTVRWKSIASGSVVKNCGGSYKNGTVCNQTINWSAPVHTARAFSAGTLLDGCSGAPSSCISTRTTTGKNVTFVDLPPNERFDIYVYIKGYLFEILGNKLTGSCSCPSSSNPPPQVSPPSSPPSYTTPPGLVSTDPNILKTLKLKISVPNLIGKAKIPLVIGGRSKKIVVSSKSKVYDFGVSKDKFGLGSKLTVIIGGNKVIKKKFSVTPKKDIIEINVGKLILGDLVEDDKIDNKDQDVLLDSIKNQTDVGDINFDGVTNSLDWALLLANFGKTGK